MSFNAFACADKGLLLFSNRVQNFKEVVVLLENIPCEQDRDCFQQRTFSIHWKVSGRQDNPLKPIFPLYP